MKNGVFLILAVFFLLPLTALGFGYPAALGLGSTMPGVDAVSHGFGGVVSVNVGGMNLFGNPAELTGYNPSLSVSIGSLILKQSVDDGLGKHALTYVGLGASSFQAGFNTDPACFALGIAKIRDYTYKGEYFFIDTNPEPMIAGFENLTVTGGVWEAAAGAATSLSGQTNLGVSAGYRTGDINYDYYWHHFNATIPDSSYSWSREEGEFSWKAGISQPLGEDSSLGVVYASSSENCPSSIAAALKVGNIAAFYPGFGIEARLYDVEESNAWTANIFGGIHPDHNLYFRGGLVLSSSGGTNSKVALGISMGSTVTLGKINVSAAFNYGNETRDSNLLGFPEAKTIEDIVTAFTAGAFIEL